jgi:enoyl-CoA hydratase
MPATPFAIETDSSPEFSGIVTIRLTQPGKPVVVLDLPLIQQLEATLNAVPRSATGLILASAAERAFVAGADLKSIQELDDAPLHAYLEYAAGVFAMLSTFPFPTVAAIHGATLGGGLELAMHCDGLVACPPPPKDGQPGRPYPVGLPEAGLAICPGWGGTNLLPARMDPASAIRATATGKPMTFDEAKSAGLFDAVAEAPEQLLTTAKRWLRSQKSPGSLGRDGAPARWVGRSNPNPSPTRPGPAAVLAALDAVRAEFSGTPAFATGTPAAAVLGAIDAGLTRGWSAALDFERRELVRLRNAPAGREAIAAFFAKSAKK